MSTNRNQTPRRRDGSIAPRVPRNMFQGANGVVISGGSFSSSLGSTTVINNYILEPQYPGGQSPNHAYGYANGSNIFVQGGGGSTYTTYYTSRPNSYTVLTSPGIASATYTGHQIYSGAPPGNFVNLHNSTHTTTVSNGSVISITSRGSSAAVQQGHSRIYMSSTNGFQFTPSTSSLREVPRSQGRDETTWQLEQGGTAAIQGEQDTMDELNSQDKQTVLNESEKNVDLDNDIRDQSGEETNRETDEDTIPTEKELENQLV